MLHHLRGRRLHGARPALPSPPMALHPGRRLLHPVRLDLGRLLDGWQVDLDRVGRVDVPLCPLRDTDRRGELVDGQKRPR